LFARRFFTKQSLLWNKDYWPGAEPYDDIPDHVFDRPDVRLVLDIGAGNGNLAVNLFRRYGDRIITVSTTLIVAAEAGTLTPPFMQLIAARGFPTVAVDIYSFFPFGESTFDVVHTSWVYHSGFTRHAIMEM
jgi:SAM-dependent methyltransferase